MCRTWTWDQSRRTCRSRTLSQSEFGIQKYPLFWSHTDGLDLVLLESSRQGKSRAGCVTLALPFVRAFQWLIQGRDRVGWAYRRRSFRLIVQSLVLRFWVGVFCRVSTRTWRSYRRRRCRWFIFWLCCWSSCEDSLHVRPSKCLYSYRGLWVDPKLCFPRRDKSCMRLWVPLCWLYAHLYWVRGVRFPWVFLWPCYLWPLWPGTRCDRASRSYLLLNELMRTKGVAFYAFVFLEIADDEVTVAKEVGVLVA